jgi:hypothetical protein
MICPSDFNFEETMTSFELMDLKMDLRMQKNKTKKDKHLIIKQLDEGALEPFN